MAAQTIDPADIITPEDIGAEAKIQLGEIRALRAYQGSNPEYHKRAKYALTIIGHYVRLRATMANEHTNRLVEMRMLGELPRKALRE